MLTVIMLTVAHYCILAVLLRAFKILALRKNAEMHRLPFGRSTSRQTEFAWLDIINIL